MITSPTLHIDTMVRTAAERPAPTRDRLPSAAGARAVYISGADVGPGLAITALGVTEVLSRRVARLAAFRPLAGADRDPLLDLLDSRFRLDAVAAGATYAEAARLIGDGHVDELVHRIIAAYHDLAEHVDVVVVIGTDRAPDGQGVTVADEVALNTRLATEMRAAVVTVIDARGRAVDAIAASARTACRARTAVRGTQIALIATGVDERIRIETLAAVADLGVPVYTVADTETVTAPTVADVTDALDGRRLLGGDEAYARDVRSIVIGGATVPTLLDHLRDGALIIIPGDRADLVVAAYAVHVAGQVTLAGIMLTLGIEPDPRVLRLVEGLGGSLPVCLVGRDTFETVARVAAIHGHLTADHPRKIAAALGAFEQAVDAVELAARLDLAPSPVITPLMFEYELTSRARNNRRRVVLPEGTEERILRAAEILLHRGICDLIVLGPIPEVRRRIRELAVDLDDAIVIDPATSENRELYAQTYAHLRAAKGITIDAARDIVTDPNYFATLMVEHGHADAMVSGAAHPTADTMRPAFEIIKTVPDVTVASSVFFMCLPEQVLVYGDCAINPDPDAQQLADIAISSAATAAAFGIEPRIAMLSYSTGSSGHGADVDKVTAATALIRAQRPDLVVDGPLQYDAAVDPDVAAAKAPSSPVAGHATVLIFPDLNTGNNTYKAVQRTAHAVAIGPVIQGLRKPVNDLSRGATVADIVNTVAITAIQAGTP
jgi:phosphate acetyltransferase